ncbi:proline-rich protein 36-like isoform X1 [Penaeus japonicus]|uniref:proline-rich protein 36-like isoform X1 n=1 Tax=Penaeus japonicus TaxID=27405 RepID=UPI001C70CC7A|nr:proline-rich protein 36-like isoform X1 [Penaeus japonicus]
MILFWILLCAASGLTAGQQLGRIPLARVTVTNPGEFGLIPGQPFWPPTTTSPPTTTVTPLNPPITAASPPVATEHASAHLNEIEVKGGGIRVQDHGYRTPPKGKIKPIAPIILQALRRLEARPDLVQGAGIPGVSLPSAAAPLLAGGNGQALNLAIPVVPGRVPALPATTTAVTPFRTAFPARRPSPRTKALIQTLLRARNQRLRGFGGTPGLQSPTGLRGVSGPPPTPPPAIAEKLATLLPASTTSTTSATSTTSITSTTTTTTESPRPNAIDILVDPEMASSPLHAQEEKRPLPDPSDSVFGRRIPQNVIPGFEVSLGVPPAPQLEQRVPPALQQLSRTEEALQTPLHVSPKLQHTTQAVQQDPPTLQGPPPHLLGQIPVIVETTTQPSVGNRPHASALGPTPSAHSPPPQANSGTANDPFTAVFETLNQKLTSQPPPPPTKLPGSSEDYYYYYEDYDDDYYYYDYEYPDRQLGPQRGHFRFPSTNPRQPTFAGTSPRRFPLPIPSLRQQPLVGGFSTTTSLPRRFNSPLVPTTLSALTTLAPGSPLAQLAPITRPALPPRPAPPRLAPRLQTRPITPPPSLFDTRSPEHTAVPRREGGFPTEGIAEARSPQLPSPPGVAGVALEAPAAHGQSPSKLNPTSNTLFKMVSSPHSPRTLGQPDIPPSNLPAGPIPPPSLRQQPPPPPKTQSQFQNDELPKPQAEEVPARVTTPRAPAPPLPNPGEALEPRIRGAVGPDDRLTLLVSPEQLRRLHHTETSAPTIRKQPVYFLPPEATLPKLATQIRRRRRPDARVEGLEGGSRQNQTPSSSASSSQEPHEVRQDSPTRGTTDLRENKEASPKATPQPPSTRTDLQASQEGIPVRADLPDDAAPPPNRHDKPKDSEIPRGAPPRQRSPVSQDGDHPRRPERERRPKFSRLPLVGFTGSEALGDYKNPEDESSHDEAPTQGNGETDTQRERETPMPHVEKDSRPSTQQATPRHPFREEAPAPPRDEILEEPAPFDEDILASHKGETVPEVQGWRKDLPYPNITIPVESPALSGLPFYISGKKELGPFFIVALD